MPAKPAPARRKRQPPPREPRLERAAWIAAARAALIEGGIERVRVLTLAKGLGVTTGSFYWHFTDRPQLLSALLTDWEESNTRAFRAAVASSADPHVQFDRIVDVWFREQEFDPAYDSAVRDWARVSPAVEAAVQRIDDQRIELLRGVFSAMGEAEPEALVRARIAYYHQVGFYAMRVRISPAERARLLPVYTRLLKGQ
ncbi:TetR/AcrR family transcriptional regulator [Erythrobacter sp. NE805]|uniref:TetR/AcrR family transcriptional regulator n=1 Tax=Erythrobacter sp. NE805 TaxID=3389875 RepID=UPI00396B240B